MAKNLRLKAYRALLDINQDEMAREINITPSTYSWKENGKSDFSKAEMEIIAKRIGQSVEEIFFINDVSIKDTNALKT